ncbi:MAG: tyrosine-type recombinase/integrase [Candidatus Nanohalobium sp.]
MTRGDIHNLDGALDNTINKIKESQHIAERDKDLLVRGTSDIPSFLSYMQSKGHSKSRMNRYLRTIFRMLKRCDWEIEEVDKTKVTEYVGELQTDNICKQNGEPYAPSTKREIKKGIRKLYTDYVDNYQGNLNLPEGFEAEEIISFTLTVTREYTDPDKLPGPETVKKLVKNTVRTRDKAYIMLLWSTGGRNGEVLGLKWKDVKFTNDIGKVVFRDTKTGGDHSVPMAEAYPFMYKHRESDPQGHNPEAFVFRSVQQGNQLSSGATNQILKRAKGEADIPEKIKVNPHAFRKGRASYWARQDMNEAWICKHMNWAPGSEIVRHYCRVAQEDVEKGVAESLGLEHGEENAKEKEARILTPSECHECGTINGFDTDNCMNCGETLKTSDLYREAKIKEMKEEIKSEMIEEEVGKSRDDIRGIAEKVVENEVMQ